MATKTLAHARANPFTGQAWIMRHNQALDSYLTHEPTSQSNEHAVLSILNGISSFARGIDHENGHGDYVLDPAIVQILDGARTLLNADCGSRLDMGTLDTYICELMDEMGYDPDTLKEKED